MTPMADQRRESRDPGMLFAGIPLAALLLGFAAAGFVDIVLLHQILQWHHFLSTLGGDLRWQVAADGWYHAAMFAVAVAGLWHLWRARDDLSAPRAGRTMTAWALIGLGGWYVVDVLVLHLGLDLHHVRMDVPNPVAWDIGFVIVFGLGPLLVGLWLRRGGTHPPSDGSPSGDGRPHSTRAQAAALASFVVLTGLLALRPGADAAHTIVAFAPSVSERDAVHAALAAGGDLVWTDGTGVVVVTGIPLGRAFSLYRSSAMFVGGGRLPAACLEWRASDREV